MRHLQLHNGTIWRWKRLLLGTSNHHTPHFRIEHRVMAAGPTLIDMIANAALYIGATHHLARQTRAAETALDYQDARRNFYQATRHGLAAELAWMDGRRINARTLLLEEIIPMAREGLAHFGLEQDECNRYRDQELPRAMSVFFGNVTAAREGVRRLSRQPDYNRIWPGAGTTSLAGNVMASAVIEDLRKRAVFAAIDIHNNTGFNPHCACCNRLDQPFLHLATLFSRTVVFLQRPQGVISAALASLYPAVVIECGKADNPARGAAYISFDNSIDHLNFCEIPVGTRLAYAHGISTVPLLVRDEQGRTISEDYLALRDGEIVTRRNIMPAMLTLDKRVIRQDCLCHFMERLNYPVAQYGP